MDSTPDYREVNVANWNERVPIHVASEFYDMPGFKKRRDSLNPFEIAEVGDVNGKTLVHLQCHFGRDTLSWAKYGATVTGVDFSATAIETASGLAEDLGIDGQFVTADVYESSEALNGQTFDVVYTGIGALYWLPDITRWAATVAQLLKPGGFLYLAEFHPIVHALDDTTGTTVSKDYFHTEPIIDEQSGTYADWNADTRHNTTIGFQHTLGAIVTAIAGAGLRIEFLHEHDFTLFQQFAQLRANSDGTYTYDDKTARVPLMYSLKATRP